MSNLDTQHRLLSSQAGHEEVRGKIQPDSASFGFPEIFRKPQTQRHPRKKRQVEEYEHYAAVVFDQDGHHFLLSSPSLKRYKRAILADAVVRAQEVLDDLSGCRQAVNPATAQVPETEHQHHTPPTLTGSISRPFDSKRRHDNNDGAKAGPTPDVHNIKSEEDHCKDGGRGSRNTVGRKEMPFPTRLQPIRVDETQRWISWFLDGFTTIQQTACRTIAKEWIKVIHPKKQSTHPYNGKMPRSEGGSPDPERTRPPYWPPHVRHKEPDHIDKADRTALLVHLLMHTPQEEVVPEKAKSERSFRARELLTALQKKQDEGVIAKWRVVEELVNARDALESYEAGGLDGDATLHVPDWGEILRPTGPRKKASGIAYLTDTAEGEMATRFDMLQGREDEEMVDEPATVLAPEQQHLPEVEYNNGRRVVASRYPEPLHGSQQVAMHRTVHPDPQLPPQTSYQNVSSRYRKSSGVNDGDLAESQPYNTVPSTVYDQSNLPTGFGAAGPGCWQAPPVPTNSSFVSNGYGDMASYDTAQNLTNQTHYVSAEAPGQVLFQSGIASNAPYGGNAAYPFNTDHSNQTQYGFNQLDRYQTMEYVARYNNMEGNLFGAWESNSSTDHNGQSLSH